MQIKTSHYEFQMNVIEKRDTFLKYHFIVGDTKNPCLEAHITLESLHTNNRFKQFENMAKLNKIDALEECAVNDITTEYLEKHSFGKEMLDAIIFIINSKFPSIKTISLDDSSYIPCNRAIGNILDLLTYSIALYKKTWYEEKLNAYILPNEKHITYRKQVDIYASEETKNAMKFDDFFTYVAKGTNPFAEEVLTNNYEKYKKIYETSDTFPIFFQEISKTITRENKCNFFNRWLMNFISSYVNIERTWYFDLYPKFTII